MKRVQYLQYGGREPRLDEVGQPEPAQGQIRVQVRAAAANPVDWKIRRGEMKAMSGSQFPRGLGRDFAGVVEAVGPGVTRLKVGDEAFRADHHPSSRRVCRIRRRRRKGRMAQAAICHVRAGPPPYFGWCNGRTLWWRRQS